MFLPESLRIGQFTVILRLKANSTLLKTSERKILPCRTFVKQRQQTHGRSPLILLRSSVNKPHS